MLTLIMIALSAYELKKQKCRVLCEEWWKLYTDPNKPMTLREIANLYYKDNGKPYTKQAVHAAFKRYGYYDSR